MKNLTNNELACLLIETAELLNEEVSDETSPNAEVLTEDSGLGALIAFFATYVGALVVLPMVANSIAKRAAAKNAKAISKEELSDAVKFFNTIGERVRTLFKQSAYKKYVEDGIITIHDKYTDFSDRKEIKHIAFEITYPVVTVDMPKLLKAYGKYDETVATEERLNDFLKKEAEKLAKILDKVREIIHQNKFVKENFTIMLVPNDNKTIYQMLIMAKSPLVFDSSKYIKNKK